MGELIRTMDWSKTPLGPPSTWPQSLRTSVSLCLSSTFPILIAWGPETIQIYNDSYRPICGAKHPESMGQNFRICWETALPVVGDAFTRGQQGEGTYIKDQQMFLDRNGYLEEAFMTFSFAPIRDESGEVGGIFHPITETTDKMLSARRTQVLRDVATRTSQAKSNPDIYTALSGLDESFALDLPFLLCYERLPDGEQARLMASSQSAPQIQVLPNLIQTDATEWLGETPTLRILEDLPNRLGSFQGAAFPEPVHTAVLLPIVLSTKAQPLGWIVAGVSPRRELDQEYQNFYALLANTINTAFSNVYAYQEEQKKAEALAAIDRAKTAFFSNVSHEFRTPLTLMLGPLEELRAESLSWTQRQNLETTHRNAQRLLKLVNNLLDFSRIEARRTHAYFQATDLLALTQDLASSFRSIIEKAGMQLNLELGPLPTVYVDPEMWEKIVLNLLSNAFKYTLQGSITVTLRQQQDQAVLRVTDTGVGIPTRELPHMFDRFHRVENAGGRTHEGTGIGLSLVQELVHMHQGSIRVESIEHKGSSFIVTVPLGRAHLSASDILDTSVQPGMSGLAGTFLEEARSILGQEEVPERTAEHPERDPHTTVLIVDDNADMRQYLVRLLDPYFLVRTATNGADALQQLHAHSIDLVLSDLMMPVMDGKQLLTLLKANPATQSIPLIFLSARAGEEARIDGLEAGADDYLVKPFSSKELLTKIRAQIKISKTRLFAAKQLRRLVEQAPVAIAIYAGPEYIVDVANAAMLQLWGRQAHQVIGFPLLEALPELKTQGFGPIMGQVYASGEGYVAGEIPLTLAGRDTPVYIQLTLEALREESGQPTGIIAIAHEITPLVIARQRAQHLATDLEDRVVERTQKLEIANQELWRVNRELEQFAYISSHDLQEPLRKIQVFANLMQTRHFVSGLQGQAYLEKIMQSADRMSQLIKDLLQFSRLTQPDELFTETDLNLVLGEVLRDFEALIAEKGARIECPSPLPRLLAIPVQLNQLFSNLLGNALKFTTDRPRIQISYDPTPVLPTAVKAPPTDYVCLRIQDNGPGFDPAYAAQLFTLFKRLDPGQTGTGIGLAICKKVAENHGGFITAQSRDGAQFDVFLPRHRVLED